MGKKTATEEREGDIVDQPAWPIRLQRRVIKSILHLYFRLRRGFTFGVRAVVLDTQGRVFLIRHTYLPGWYLPGGGVEVGETATEALARELKEEACIEVVGAPELHGVFLNRRASNRDHVLIYIVRAFNVLAIKQPDWEIAEAGFFPVDSLPEQTTPATRRRLAEILNREVPHPYW